MMLTIGLPAPDFILNATPDQQLSVSSLKGQKVIIAFYPADWSPVCSDQLALYNEVLPFFHKHNAVLLAISVDGKWCHLAFSKERKFHFPLLADFEPKGFVSRLFDVYDEKDGQSQRALYVLDESGIIRWNYLSPKGINPGADGILDALEAMDAKK